MNTNGKTTKGLRLVVGCRVSTRDQKDRGTSLETQEAEARRYAEFIGATVVEVIPEDVSGRIEISRRKKQARILELLESGQADGVLWYAPDRMSRKLSHALSNCEWLDVHGKRLFFVSDGELRLRPLDIGAVVKFWSSEDEREKIRERTSRGKQKHSANGEVICGKVPFYLTRHYDPTTDKWEAELNEYAPIAKRMHTWLRAGVTCNRIATRLNQSKTPTPRAMQYLAKSKPVPPLQNKISKSRASNEWNEVAVRNVLVNPALCGRLHYGGYEWVTDESDPRLVKANDARKQEKKKELTRLKCARADGEDGKHVIAVPAVITPKQYEDGLRILNERMLFSKRHAKRDYLLRGLVRHSCGLNMVGQGHRDESFACYRCNVCVMEHKPRATISQRNLEAWVIAKVEGLMRDKAAFREAVQSAYEQQRASVEPIMLELENVERRLAELRKDADDIAKALLSDIAKRRAVRESLEHRAELNERETNAFDARKRELEAKLVLVPNEQDLAEVLDSREVYLRYVTDEPARLKDGKANALAIFDNAKRFNELAEAGDGETYWREMNDRASEIIKRKHAKVRRLLEFAQANVVVTADRAGLKLQLGDASELAEYEVARDDLAATSRAKCAIGIVNTNCSMGKERRSR